MYPLGSLSEHLLSWFVLTKAWFFPFWSDMKNNVCGVMDLSHFHSICSLGQTSLSNLSVGETLANKDCQDH